MAKQIINIGTDSNDGAGDALRDAFVKVNTNFTELYDNDAADTLDAVTTLGNTTTNSITVGGLIVDTDTLYVDSTNNRVGIGTTSPQSILDIRSDTTLDIRLGNSLGVNGYKLKSNVSSTADFGFVIEDFSGTDLYNVKTGVGGYHRFLIDGSEAMRINSSGRVGIGTDSPDAKLDVEDSQANSTIARFRDNSGTAQQTLSISSIATGMQIRSAYNTGISNQLDIQTSGGNSFLTLSPNSTEAVRIDSLGRVGIGTTSPSSNLSVQSTGTASGTVAVFGNGNISDGLQIITSDGNLEWGFNALNSRSLVFQTNQTERLRIDSSGNVGIGTSSPASKLSVNGGTIRVQNNNPADVTFYEEDKINSYATSGYTVNGREGLTLETTTANTDIILSPTGKVEVGDGLLSFGKTVYGPPSSEDFFRIKFKDFGGTQNDVGIGQPDEWSLGFNTNPNGVITFNKGTSGETMRIDSSGRVGIGTTSPSANALLDVSSSTKGVLLPRMTTTEVNAISSPENGLTVYNTTLNTLCFYNGTSWQKVTSANM
tara:strand:+ start:8569 stop:10191 length:1623 start_codon:yes stop_codon:yes gene_type:complete